MRSIFLLFLALAFTAYSCGGSSEASGEATTSTDAPTAAENAPDEAPAPAEAAAPAPAEMARQSAPPATGSFEERLTAGPVTFIVESPNASSNYFTLNTEGMSVRNEETKMEVDGAVVRAQLADLNQDSYPEVYIFTRSDSGTEEVYAFASYRNRSYGQIYMAEAENAANQRGREGVETFELTETALLQKIAASQSGQRTGDTQTVTYALKQGETSYRLEPVE
jgi:ribosomal protein S18 acetylase RimI-like enzyme